MLRDIFELSAEIVLMTGSRTSIHWHSGAKSPTDIQIGAIYFHWEPEAESDSEWLGMMKHAFGILLIGNIHGIPVLNIIESTP